MLSNLVPQRASGGAVIRFFGGAAKTARLSGLQAVGRQALPAEPNTFSHLCM